MSRLLVFIVVAFVFALRVAAQSDTFDWSTAKECAPGIRYVRQDHTEPRPLHLHVIRIDALNPRIRFHTTAAYDEWVGNLHETRRTSTRDFLHESRAAGLDMVAAINADAFEPWPAPYAQRSLSDLRGLAVSRGELVSPPLQDGASFVVHFDKHVSVERTVSSVNGIEAAVSGFAIVLEDGVASGTDTRLAPRTGIGVSKNGRYVIWLVFDGRRHASQGATTPEVGNWLRYFGADDGVNLDGGGSATMARYDSAAPGDGVVLLNSPVGDGTDWTKRDVSVEQEQYKPTERANGNNLGVYFTK